MAMRNLGDLLGSVPEQTFLRHFVEKKPLFSRDGNGAAAAQVLPLRTIDWLVSNEIVPRHSWKMLINAQPLAPVMYRDQGDETLKIGAARSLFAQGASFVIYRIDRYAPDVAALADAIGRRLGLPVTVNCYVSSGSGRALMTHYDTHDVLVLHTHGAKQWRTYGSPRPLPVSHTDKKNNIHPAPRDPLWQDALVPGSFLYLPRGEIHDAVPMTTPSVHLTFALSAPTGLDFLAWLAKRGEDDVVRRADVTRLLGREAFEAHETALKKSLHALIDEASLEDFLAQKDGEVAPRPTLNLSHGNAMCASDWVVPLPRRDLPRGATDLPIEIAGTAYPLSPLERDVLNALMEEGGALLGTLASALDRTADDPDFRLAVENLATHGLAAIARKEP
jgi:ribosomal protein L16 Arg81 hydroxylase